MGEQQTLCEWDKKEIEKKSIELVKLVSNSKYYCKKCARSSNNKNVLCKPQKFKK